MATADEIKKLQELIDLVKAVQMDTKVEFSKLNGHIENLQKNHSEFKQEIEEFYKMSHDPNDGIYKRINDISHDLKSIFEDQTDITDTIHTLKEKVNEIESVKDNLVKIAGDRLEILDSAIKTSQNSKKILWTFILAAVSIAGEQIAKILKFFF